MGVRETPSRHPGDGLTAGVRALRAHWRTASLASGWPFPSDWALPEVDRVCVAAHLRRDLVAPLAELGRARAAAGAGLAETLADLAALHAVLDTGSPPDGFVAADPDALPAPLLRAASVAWADVAVASATSTEVRDSLTGLATAGYLRTRLREVYAACRAGGVAPERDTGLVVVGVEVSGAAGWSRLSALVLAADVLRGEFTAGETLAALGPSVVVALAARPLQPRTAAVRARVTARFGVDPHLLWHCRPRVWTEALPARHAGACALLDRLARA